jgi:hypothetical protein
VPGASPHAMVDTKSESALGWVSALRMWPTRRSMRAGERGFSTGALVHVSLQCRSGWCSKTYAFWGLGCFCFFSFF